MLLENMILGQLKMGVHQVKYRALGGSSLECPIGPNIKNLIRDKSEGGQGVP